MTINCSISRLWVTTNSTGATHTKNNFKKVVNDLLEKAKAGETYEPQYEDGVYKAEAEEASHGWIGKIKIVVKKGTIVGVNYKEVAVKDMTGEKVVFDKDGNPIKKDGEYKTKKVEIEKGDIKSMDNYKYLESPKAMKKDYK
mgnify:CR=1 FL=1